MSSYVIKFDMFSIDGFVKSYLHEKPFTDKEECINFLKGRGYELEDGSYILKTKNNDFIATITERNDKEEYNYLLNKSKS